jgi:hypothetical protein
MSTYTQSGPRAVIFHAPNPVSALLVELQELKKSLDCPPSVQLPPGTSFATLRETLEVRGEACSQECRRIAVVLSDSQASGASLTLVNIRGLCANVGESVALFTAIAQALRELVVQGCGGVLLPGECFLVDLAHGCGGLIGSACEFVVGLEGCLPTPLEEDATVVPITKAASLLPLVARMQQWSAETLRKLPKTVASAVKRRFLSTSVTLKRSAVDVREETGVEATASPTASAAASLPPNPFPSPAAGAAVVSAAIALFKASHTLVAATSTLCDLDVEGVVGVGGANTPSSSSSTTTTTLDTLARSVEPVENGAIDLAAAVSDAYTILTGQEEGEDDFEDFDGFDEEEEEEEEKEEKEEKKGKGGGDGGVSSSLVQTLEALEETLGPYLLSLEDLGRTAEACTATLQLHGKGGEGAGSAVQAALVAARECGKAVATALQRRAPPS